MYSIQDTISQHNATLGYLLLQKLENNYVEGNEYIVGIKNTFKVLHLFFSI